MPKSIISGPEALTKLLAGINRIADPVKATLGPSGKNTIYERLGTNLPVSTRDGVTVAEQIEAIDPHEQMGVALIQGVAHEAVDQSGDGTTTATLLAQAIFGEGVKAITVGANPVAIKRGIEKATRFVLECLRNMAIPVSGDMLRQVATISANNDSFLGRLIADAIEKAGPDGVVTVEVSQSPESSLQVVDGLQFAAGYILPEFVTNPARNECVLEDVAIYLHEKKLATILPMRPLLNKLKEAGKSLLVIAEDVTDEALAVLAISASKGQFRCAAIRTPGGVDHLHDIAALTGARVHTELLGVRPENVGMDFLGSAKRVIAKAQSTTIIADSSKDGLGKKLEELRAQVADATDEGQRLRLQARLARLAGGVVIIKVGAATELEMHEKRDRVEDAMHATRGAQKEGVVPGGGIALLRCQQIPTQGWSEDERAGALIVSKACHAPLRTLAENCGESPEYIDKQVHQSVDTSTGMYSVFGWDARTNKFGDMIEMGILDPLRVVRVALESASSVAALSLITNCLVANERK
jgi:chaperonin GroEL